MTPHSSRLQVQRYVFKVGARTVEMRMRPEAVLYVLAPDAEQTPGTPNAPDSRQAAAVSVAPGGQTSRTTMHTCRHKTVNWTCRRLMRCVRPHRRRGYGEDKSRVMKCGMRSCITDNGNHVSPSRSNGNDTDNPNKRCNPDARCSVPGSGTLLFPDLRAA